MIWVTTKSLPAALGAVRAEMAINSATIFSSFMMLLSFQFLVDT